MTEYRSVLEREPQNPDALRGLGYCLLIQERYNEAVDALAKAHAAQPGHPQGMVWLAQAHGLAGQLGQAKSIFRQVLVIEPGNSDAARGIQEIEGIEQSGQKRKTKS
jgi:uncharacterized protein HemY